MPRLRSLLLAALLGGTLVVAQPAPALADSCNPVSKEGGLDHEPWGQARMDAERVWPLTRGEGVKVAVIDSGVSDAHPVLKGKVDYGKDYVEPEEEGTAKVGADCDLVGHGTSIAGVIAGREDSGSPFAGMAPDAKLLSIRILPDLRGGGRELPGNLAKAIREAADSGADVINLSVQVVHASALEKAVKYAAKKGAVLVAAAGNMGGKDGTNEPQYPAAYDHDAVLAVSAMGPEGIKTESSNTGDYVDVAAPGEEIVGPGPEGEGFTGGEDATGTSFSAGFVSGTVALVRSRHPDLNAKEAAGRVRATAQSPPHIKDQQVGFGTVDPYRAVTADLGKAEPAEDMRGPGVDLRADTQLRPRHAAAIILGLVVALGIAVGCARVVFPIVWRKRKRRKELRAT